MTGTDRAHVRPAGWIRHTPGYGLPPSTDPLPPAAEPPGPPRWLFHTVCAGAALWLLWKASTPVPSLGAGLGAAIVLGIAALIWLARLVIAVLSRAPVDPWWAVAPAGGALILALLWVDAPAHARFSLADGELGQLARQVAAAPDPSAAAGALGDLGRVGTYRVSRVEAEQGVVYFTFRTGDGFLDGAGGVAYLPSPNPWQDGLRDLRHLRGPWYVWTDAAAD